MYNSYTNVIIFYFRSRKRRGSETVSEEGGSSSEESLKRVSSSRRRNMRLREGGDEKRTLTSSPIMSECTAAMVSKYFIFHQILSLPKNSDGWFFGQLKFMSIPTLPPLNWEDNVLQLVVLCTFMLRGGINILISNLF